ncbi:MAG: hypothetical protein P8X96_10485 [Desulfobacteraceae bacterium]
MTRRHKGNFSAKHPPDTTIPPEVSAAVTSRISNGNISCRSACDLATALSVPPSMIGTAIDLSEGRITQCQLGLFGHPQKPSALQPGEEIDEQLQAEIEAALENNRLSCKRAWKIAADRSLPRRAIGSICETLNVRINRCQLGAF